MVVFFFFFFCLDFKKIILVWTAVKLWYEPWTKTIIIRFGLILWHINTCKLLMPNPLLHIQIVQFQTIQFSGTGSDGNEEIFRITWTSALDCFVSYPGYLLGWGYPSAEKQSVYSTAPADWACCPVGWGCIIMLIIRILFIFFFVSLIKNVISFDFFQWLEKSSSV